MKNSKCKIQNHNSKFKIFNFNFTFFVFNFEFEFLIKCLGLPEYSLSVKDNAQSHPT